MSEAWDDVVSEAAQGKVAPLYLFWGEEFLVRQAADALVKVLVPDAAAGLNCVALDAASPREVAQELATLPLFPGRKVVLVRDPEFLAPKKGRTDALNRARQAWQTGRRQEGARRVLALAARAGWGPEALDLSAPGAPSASAWKEELGVELASADVAFLQEVAAFCKEERLRAPEGDAGALLQLLEKGVPQGHALVMAATDVDAKSPLVKFAKESGRLIERKVATRLKEFEVGALAAEFLRPLRKRLGKGAEEELKQRVGANVRLLQSELEKLALYVSGSVIEREDVEQLVARVREEEFLELSDALQKRDLRLALRYAEDALGQGVNALQLLGAVASITRALLENHERLGRHAKGAPPRSFDDFKSRVFPRLEEEAKAAQSKPPHPYAAFLGMQAAARFGRKELLSALSACAEADLALKSSAQGRPVIERLLWTLCAKGSGL